MGLRIGRVWFILRLRLNGKRGRVKRSKARNLVERLIHYEDDVLRFMANSDIPFANNLGERDIRITKVQQKFGVFPKS